ncbi:MAG: hypothetical protein JWO13_3903 [Acidobacteriales bacterium]|nr:hypothetical protein [Terriglobales bacterium]
MPTAPRPGGTSRFRAYHRRAASPDQEIVLGVDATTGTPPDGDGSPHTTRTQAEAVVPVSRTFVLGPNDPELYNNAGCSIDLTITRK